MFSFHRPDRAKDVLMILAWWWWMIMWGQLAPRLPEQKACCLPTQLLQPFSSSLPFSKIWNIVTTQKLFSRIVLCLKTPFGEVEQKVWKLAVEDGALHIPPIHISYSSTYIFIPSHLLVKLPRLLCLYQRCASQAPTSRQLVQCHSALSHIHRMTNDGWEQKM